MKPPTAKNTYKALRMQIYASNPIFMILSFVSYWAYGSSVEPVLLNSLRGPKVWIAAANAAAFIQAVISLHVSNLAQGGPFSTVAGTMVVFQQFCPTP